MTHIGAEPTAGALVEVATRDEITGWVEVAAGAQPPVVELFVDDLRVDTATVTDGSARRARGEVRAFRFALADLWRYVGPGNRIGVRVARRSVPIAGVGMWAVPEEHGDRTLEELAERLAAGERFGRTGHLHLSKSLDAEWQQAALALQAEVGRDLAATGRELFLAYGTLLGAVRDDQFIGRDLDFDCAFISEHREAAAAARDLQAAAFALIDLGYAVRARPTFLQVTKTDQPDVRINLFHLYFAVDGGLRFPHGAAGPALAASDWTGTQVRSFTGASVPVPARVEEFLAATYGPDWRVPDPGFSWAQDRTRRASDAALPSAAIEEIYWADFYARADYTHGSTFFELVNARPELPSAVVDIGCGDGRDSFAFAAAGRTKVTGLDRSHIGLRHADAKAATLGYGASLHFEVCDVSDAERLRATLAGARDGDQPLAFYARFFLHSIPEEVQRTLMGVISDVARPGDYFLAEFRTDRDEAIEKVHGNHYRRFQSGAAFSRALQDTYGFAPLLEQEGNGFSPYRGEDPQLYRVIARRP